MALLVMPWDSAENTSAPVVKWEEFLSKFNWRQGEHIAMIGPTGSGKTTLALAILDRRAFVTVLATKPQDVVLDTLKDQGFIRLKEWKDYDPIRMPKRLIWPDASDLYSATKQRQVFRYAIRSMYKQGGWCIYIDELWFIIHHLKLQLEVKTLLQQSRSLYNSLIVLTQRPAFVPLEVYDQSTHLFFWRDNDERNLKRLSGVSWRSAKEVQTLVANLEQYQVLYFDLNTGMMLRVTPPYTEGSEK